MLTDGYVYVHVQFSGYIYIVSSSDFRTLHASARIVAITLVKWVKNIERHGRSNSECFENGAAVEVMTWVVWYVKNHCVDGSGRQSCWCPGTADSRWIAGNHAGALRAPRGTELTIESGTSQCLNVYQSKVLPGSKGPLYRIIGDWDGLDCKLNDLVLFCCQNSRVWELLSGTPEIVGAHWIKGRNCRVAREPSNIGSWVRILGMLAVLFKVLAVQVHHTLSYIT